MMLGGFLDLPTLGLSELIPHLPHARRSLVFQVELGEGVIISDPEVYTWALDPHSLMVVAVTDGISGALDDQEICNFGERGMRRSFSGKGFGRALGALGLLSRLASPLAHPRPLSCLRPTSCSPQSASS